MPVKDHELYSQKPLKDLPKEHHNFRHYLVFLSIFQKLLVMNIGSWLFLKNPLWYFDGLSLVWLFISSHKICSNGFDKSSRILTGISFDLSWQSFFLYSWDISIFQLIREFWIFDVLIETFCYGSCYNVGVPLENLDWCITFWCCFFIVYIIDFAFHVLSIKIFKRKSFGIFKRTFCSQITWLVFVFF